MAHATEMPAPAGAPPSTDCLRDFDEKSVAELPHGVVVVKNFLTEDEQLGILLSLFDVVDPHSLKPNKDGRHTPLLMYNWPRAYGDDLPSKIAFTDADVETSSSKACRKSCCNTNRSSSKQSRTSPQQKIESVEPAVCQHFVRPQSVLDFGRLAFEKIQAFADAHQFQCSPNNPDPSLSPRLKIPKSMSANALYAILYPEDGKLEPHHDMFMGWVLSVSIGASCRFFYQLDLEDDPIQLILESGDLVLFNGAKLYHGVTEVMVETTNEFPRFEQLPARNTSSSSRKHGMPEFWRKAQNSGLISEHFARLNLQFRDPSHMRNFRKMHEDDSGQALEATSRTLNPADSGTEQSHWRDPELERVLIESRELRRADTTTAGDISNVFSDSTAFDSVEDGW